MVIHRPLAVRFEARGLEDLRAEVVEALQQVVNVVDVTCVTPTNRSWQITLACDCTRCASGFWVIVV